MTRMYWLPSQPREEQSRILTSINFLYREPSDNNGTLIPFGVKTSPPSGRPGNDTARVFVYIELDL